MAARVPVPSNLNLGAWKYYLGILGDRENVLDFITYGFPTGYAGPISNTLDTTNHPSATNFPEHIEEFISKELSLKGVVGPYAQPPFAPWCHVSPLMSREKGDTGKRRVITDMTFPPEKSVNAFIVKNSVYGFEYHHSLPTVETLSDRLRERGQGAFLSSIDVSRAYKNFVSDPLDWPLLCFKWGKDYFCDLSMPFGARASSFHMQSVANCITDILALYGIQSLMYLDDLIIVSPDRDAAWRDYNRARRLLRELGLPEAEEKAQPPSQRVKWLGIMVDAARITLSIPEVKVKAVLAQVDTYFHKDHITKKQLQSLLGHLIFIAKCVRPARIFVSRLLEALRSATGDRIHIDNNFRADLAWFQQFCAEWNGVGVITPSTPSKVLLVDACLTGVGGTDGQFAYGQQVAEGNDPAANITELEAANVVIALHTLLSRDDRGRHVRVRCDNQAAVAALRTGRARNKVLQECARAAWMAQALLGVDISYDHIPGKDNETADALSRFHLSTTDEHRADSLVAYYSLSPISPCMFFMYEMDAVLSSRSGAVIAPARRNGSTGGGQSPGDCGQPQSIGLRLHRLYEEVWKEPPRSVTSDDLRISGVCRAPYTSARHAEEQSLAHQVIPPNGGGVTDGHQPPQGQDGSGSIRQGQIIYAAKEGPPPRGRVREGHGTAPGLLRGEGSESSLARHLLWSHETVGGNSPHYEQVRQVQTPHKGGLYIQPRWCHAQGKVGQKHAKGLRTEDGVPPAGTTVRYVPSECFNGQLYGGPNSIWLGPSDHVAGVTPPTPCIPSQESMGRCAEGRRHTHGQILTPQLKKNGCHSSAFQRLFRAGDTAPRGVEIKGSQDLYRHPNWPGHCRAR